MSNHNSQYTVNQKKAQNLVGIHLDLSQIQLISKMDVKLELMDKEMDPPTK